jgi:integrase
MSLTGSCFSSESAPRPFHHGSRRRRGTIYWAALPSDEWQVQATKRTHLKRRLEDGEEERLLAACDRGRTPLLKQLVVLAIETGMRRGELLGLRWEHVHLAKRIVHLPITKNGESRDVPLSRRATDTITDLFKRKQPKIDLVFPMSGNSVRLAFEHLRVRAKMADLHFHDLRHEAITRLGARSSVG